MKVLLSVFAMCVVSYKGVTADTDYGNLAVYLKTNTTNLITYLNEVDGKIQSIHSNLIQTTNAIDFKIAQNKQMIELHASIEAHKTSAGIKECVDLLDHKSLDLINELKSTFVDAVEEQINLNKAGLSEKRQELLGISQSLEGQSLDKEIETCKSTPQNCRITVDFPNALTRDAKYVSGVEDLAGKLVETTLTSTVMPAVPDKINNKIYVPVNECIRNLA